MHIIYKEKNGNFFNGKLFFFLKKKNILKFPLSKECNEKRIKDIKGNNEIIETYMKNKVVKSVFPFSIYNNKDKHKFSQNNQNHKQTGHIFCM